MNGLPPTFAELDLAGEFRHLLGIVLALLQPFLVLLLCVGFILALAHLLIMLGTRWGDRRVTSKALFFSVAVHISLAFGIIAMVPEYRQRFIQTLISEEEPLPVQVESTPLEAETATELDQSGNTPIWRQMTDLPQQDTNRMARTTSPDESNPFTPKPEFDTEERLTPDVSYLPLETEVLPQQRPEADTGPMEIAAIPLPVDDPVAEARPDIEFPSTSQQRSPVVSNAATESEEAQRPEVGMVERLTPDFDPQATLKGLDAPLNADAPLRNDDPDMEISRREGPAPSVLPTEMTGRGETNVPQPASNTAPGPPQVARERSRSPQNITDSGVQRVRPGVRPQLPDVEPGQPIASITGQGGTGSIVTDLPGLRDSDNSAGRLDAIPVPGTYQLRTPQQQDLAVEEFGGTEASEEAVDLALHWLASVQTDVGFWDGEAHGAGRVQQNDADRDDPREGAGVEADAGLTGLAILAFLAKQHTVEQGEYAPNVERGLRWLVSQQRADGFLGGEASKVSAMYCHAIATFALAEAYAMRTDPTSGDWMRDPLQLAVEYILSCQLSDGGWRYERGQPDGDMSMFGWQLMALKSAEQAGLTIPEDARTRMVAFLRDRSLGESGGHAAYRATEAVSASMTAEALFCKQMLGMTRDNPASIEAVTYLQAHAPRRTELDLYYWYYGTLAMFQYGGDSWEEWNESMRDILVFEQRKSGPLAGSWDPRDPWGPYGGRIYSTAMSAMCLEVYYRYLPLYQGGGRYGEE